MPHKRRQPNERVQAISWLTRGTKVYTEGETFVCDECGNAFEAEVLDLAHRIPVRKDRSGSFQSQAFGRKLLGMPIEQARETAHALCRVCHGRETAKQAQLGWAAPSRAQH